MAEKSRRALWLDKRRSECVYLALKGAVDGNSNAIVAAIDDAWREGIEAGAEEMRAEWKSERELVS